MLTIGLSLRSSHLFLLPKLERRRRIEQGVDENTGRKCYKMYYEQES